MFSLHYLEKLPLIERLPLTTAQKRVAGAITLISSSLTAFAVFLLLFWRVFIFQAPVKEPLTADKPIEKTPPPTLSHHSREQLTKDALLFIADHHFRRDNYYKSALYYELIIGGGDRAPHLIDRFAHSLVKIGEKAKAEPLVTLLRSKGYSSKTLTQTTILLQPEGSDISRFLAERYPDYRDDPEILIAKAEKLLFQNPELAKTTITHSLKLNPNSARAHLLLAKLYGSNDNRQAIANLRKAVELAPLNPQYRGLLAQHLRNEGALAGAQRQYRALFFANPDEVNFLFPYATLLREIGQRDSAFHYANRYIQENPESAEANFFMGLIFAEDNRDKGALDFFINAHRRSPREIRYMLQLAATYERLGNIGSARDIYSKILREDPKNEISLYKLRILR